MSTAGVNASTEVIDGFRQDVANAKVQHATLIAELEADLIGATFELSQSFAEFCDELSGNLAARAANACADEADQETAIAQCESMLSNEVTHDPMLLACACVAFHGPQNAAAVIGKMVSESPLRDSFSVGQ
jgi:hypothetical protein